MLVILAYLAGVVTSTLVLFAYCCVFASVNRTVAARRMRETAMARDWHWAEGTALADAERQQSAQRRDGSVPAGKWTSITHT